MRLSGWQRMGIVCSVVWAVGGYIGAERTEGKAYRRALQDIRAVCDLERTGNIQRGAPDAWPVWTKCYDEAAPSAKAQSEGIMESRLSVALGALAFAWVVAGIVAVMTTWVLRGFGRQAQ